MYMYAGVLEEARGIGVPELEVQVVVSHQMWVRTELEYSARAAHTFSLLRVG